MEKNINNVPFAALSVEEAKNIIINALAEVIKVPAKPVSQQKKEVMTIDEAIQFFNENCYPILRTTLYQKVWRKEVPYHKINNKRLVFYRSELEEWIRQRTTSANDSIDNTVLLLAESANRKK